LIYIYLCIISNLQCCLVNLAFKELFDVSLEEETEERDPSGHGLAKSHSARSFEQVLSATKAERIPSGHDSEKFASEKPSSVIGSVRTQSAKNGSAFQMSREDYFLQETGTGVSVYLQL